MKDIIEKIKNTDTPLLVIYGAIALCTIILLYGIFGPSSGDEKEGGPSVNGLELPEDGRAITNFETKLEAYGTREVNGSELDLDLSRDLFSGADDNREPDPEKLLLLQQQIDEAGDKEGDPYAQEDDPKVQELQRQIELMERERQKGNNVPMGVQERTGGGPKRAKTKEELERERLERELEAYRKFQQAESSPKEGMALKKEPIWVRASIYNDHYIFPGDRVTLLLNEDLVHDGKKFPQNTFIYAVASFSDNRVLLDIQNIQHEPISLRAMDLQDGREGMYVAQVAEFREKYRTQLEGDAIGGGATELGATVNQRLVGKIITGVGNMFKNDRLKKKDRVFLINDHQVFLTNKTQ